MSESSATWQVVRLDDPESFSRLAKRIRDIEPTFELFQPDPHARFFEPEGTTYSLQLRAAQTWHVHGREIRVERGDMLIIPQSLALDAEGATQLIALRHSGEAPDHFRERFVQVWGVDHLKSMSAQSIVARQEIVFPTEMRYRVPYTVLNLQASQSCRLHRPSFWHALLIVTLEGSVKIQAATGRRAVHRDELALIEGGGPLDIGGPGDCAVLSILTEARYLEARAMLRAGGTSFSPEFSPNDGLPS